MVDPVSALATATAAFNVLKKGFQIGRDIESMASDLGRWMNAMSDLSEAERQAKNPPLFKKLAFKGSIEQEAMEIFAAKKKADQMRQDLKNFIGFTYGASHWDELIRMEAQIRKQRQETIYKQAQRRKKFIEGVAIGFLILVFSAVILSFVWLVYAARTGQI